MRASLLLLSLCFAAAAQPQGSVSGAVVNSATDVAMRDVHVRVTPADENSSAAYGAITDAAGNFSIAAIPSGTYLVQAQRYGFYFVPSAKTGPSSITLKPGQRLEDVRLGMVARAVISGRVFDERGEPLEYVGVNVHAAAGSEGALEMTLELLRISIDNVSSNRNGEYRVAVPPGKYTIQAHATAADEIRPDGKLVPAYYSNTFYSTVAGQQAAAIVETRAGEETAGIDIHMVRHAPLSISGIVTGQPRGAPSTLHIMREWDQSRFVGLAGHFSVGDLEPGEYRVFAESGSGDALLRSPNVTLDLQSDVANLNLVLRAPASLSGSLELPESAAKAALPVVRLELAANTYEARRNPLNAPVERDGKFQFPRIQPDRYYLSLTAAAPDSYFKLVRVDGREATEREFESSFGSDGMEERIKVPVDLSDIAGGGVMQIVLGNGGQVTGMVEGRSAGSVPALARVLLVPEGQKSSRGRRYTSIGADGSYTIHALAPGKYRLLAEDIFALRADDENWFEKQLAQAESVEIHEGERLTRNLKPVGKESGDGK